MLRRVQLQQRLLEGRGVAGNLRVLHAVAACGQAGVRFLNLQFDGGELAGFEVGELLLRAGTGCRLCSRALRGA